VLKLSNGEEIDAGDLAAIDGRVRQVINTQLANPQIVVSSVAPSNPQINDLWLQI
jgi:hypothetical protein